ncbi:MAG: o-succinylbenzoate--CoA ligase [Actinomycetota bacterium]|nr:o-succinylbenzoate--CoA ligase [Actinomycetota bacterium]
MPRRLTPLPIPAGPDALATVLPALAVAIDGSGPALVPLPHDPAAATRLVAALRPDHAGYPLEHDVALVVPTTGSTGKPKGALLGAPALTASAAATIARLGGPGRWLLALPLTHVAGLQVLVRSLVGGTEPAALDLTRGFHPDDFAAATARLPSRTRRYTSLVPTQLARLLDAGPPAVEALRAYDAVLLGGAAAPPTLLDRAQAAGVRVVATYGMTETCGGCVYDGRPLNGVRVGIGGDGRVRVSGPVLFAGYRLRPDLTAAALTDGELVTQDLGRVDAQGRLEILGRADDVVVSGGENVALCHVEDALREHPGLREAAVVAVPDAQWGQRLVAVVVPHGPAPSIAELRAWVGARVGQAGAPRGLLVLDALPLAGPGKLDRQALRRRVQG